MFDIDHFKLINDEHGHLAGDVVLKELARLVQARIRRDEILARYGGEEFVVMLPETDLEGAAALAETLRARVEEHPFTFQSDRISVTISLGCAVLCDADRSATELLKRADERLYEAKRSGRNRVCS
jgi:diguanylate cyclase (GGDEF)-like protein